MSENENLETSLELGYGARLRAEREAREIGVDEVCRQLNLHRKVVEALEAEEQSKLPSPAFVRGYLRSYARMLGLDGDLLVRDYNSRGTEDPIPGSMTSIGEQPRSDHPVMRWATIVIIVLIVALLGAWLLTRGSGLSDMLGSTDDTASNSVVITPQPASDAAAAVTESGLTTAGISGSKPLVISASEPEIEEGSEAADTETAAASAGETDAAAAVEAEPAQGDANEDSVSSSEAAAPEAEESAAEAAVAEVAEVAPSQPATEADDSEAPAIEPEPPEVVESVVVVDPEPESEGGDSEADQRLLSSGEDVLELSADEDSWVEISDAIGNRLMFDMLRGGESRSLRGTAPFRVFLGNAPPVSMNVNGSSVDRPRVSSRNTARFVVEADGSQHR